MVGGPGSTEICSRSTSSRTAAGSKTATGKIVAPRMSEARHPALYPKMWKNGFAIRYRSPARRSAQSHQARYARSVWPCVITTPLGLPVVPEVKTTSLGSSGPIDARRASRSAPETASPRARKSSQPTIVRVGVTGQQDRLLEVGQGNAGFREQGRVVGVEEPAHGEEGARAAAGEDERGLRTLEARVDRDEHAPGRRDTERGDDPLERVRRPHRDPVAALDPGRDERPGGAVDQGRELGEPHPSGRRRRPRRRRRTAAPRPGPWRAPWAT